MIKTGDEASSARDDLKQCSYRPMFFITLKNFHNDDHRIHILALKANNGLTVATCTKV